MKYLILLLLYTTAWGQVEWNPPSLTVSGTDYNVPHLSVLYNTLSQPFTTIYSGVYAPIEDGVVRTDVLYDFGADYTYRYWTQHGGQTCYSSSLPLDLDRITIVENTIMAFTYRVNFTNGNGYYLSRWEFDNGGLDRTVSYFNLDGTPDTEVYDRYIYMYDYASTSVVPELCLPSTYGVSAPWTIVDHTSNTVDFEEPSGEFSMTLWYAFMEDPVTGISSEDYTTIDRWQLKINSLDEINRTYPRAGQNNRFPYHHSVDYTVFSDLMDDFNEYQADDLSLDIINLTYSNVISNTTTTIADIPFIDFNFHSNYGGSSYAEGPLAGVRFNTVWLRTDLIPETEFTEASFPVYAGYAKRAYNYIIHYREDTGEYLDSYTYRSYHDSSGNVLSTGYYGNFDNTYPEAQLHSDIIKTFLLFKNTY